MTDQCSLPVCKHDFTLPPDPSDPGWCPSCLRGLLVAIREGNESFRHRVFDLEQANAGLEKSLEEMKAANERLRAESDAARILLAAHVRRAGNGLVNVIGKWPGEETDAEIEEALREIS